MPNIDKQLNLKSLHLKVPSFLIIGVQKAGTTALYEYLSIHPQIKATTIKELHFFNSEIRYAKGLAYYLSLFPSIDNDKLTFDASPSYLASDIAYRRIYEYNPNIKMVVLLRDPVDRAYAAWNMYKERYQNNRNWFFDDWVSFIGNAPDQYVRRSDWEIFNFEKFVKSELKYLSSSPIKRIESPVLIQGQYREHLSKFLTLFKRDQFLVLESSSFRKNTAEILETIESFISVPRFDWSKINLPYVFEGNYAEEMRKSTAVELSNYYAPHNDALYKLLGVHYNWK